MWASVRFRRGENNEVDDPPKPPLVKGGAAFGRAFVSGATRTTEWATLPIPRFLRGSSLWASVRFRRGENNEVGDPPKPPLVKGGSSLRAGVRFRRDENNRVGDPLG